MRNLYLIIVFILFSTIHADDLNLDSLRLDAIEDSIFLKKSIDSLHVIKNIIISKPRIDYYDSTLLDYTNSFDLSNYKFYDPIKKQYKLYFSTFFGQSRLYSNSESHLYDPGYNFGFHLTLPYSFSLLNKSFIIGSELSTSIIPSTSLSNYKLLNISATATTSLWKKIYIKINTGISSAYYDSESKIIPALSANIYYELDLKKYIPIMLIFSNGIQILPSNFQGEENPFLINNFNVSFCKKYLVNE